MSLNEFEKGFDSARLCISFNDFSVAKTTTYKRIKTCEKSNLFTILHLCEDKSFFCILVAENRGEKDDTNCRGSINDFDAPIDTLPTDINPFQVKNVPIFGRGIRL